MSRTRKVLLLLLGASIVLLVLSAGDIRQKYLDTQLVQAVRDQNAVRVRALIERGANPQGYGWNGESAWTTAINLQPKLDVFEVLWEFDPRLEPTPTPSDREYPLVSGLPSESTRE